MSAPRQQRAARNRRALTPAAPVRTALANFVVVSQSGNSIVLALNAIPQPATYPPALLPMQINGIPQVLRQAGSLYPSAATLDPATSRLTLTYGGSPLEAGETFWLGPWDPAVRTTTGGFIAPSSLTYLGQPPNQQLFTAVSSGGVTVTIAPSGAGIADMVFKPMAWRNVTSGWDATDFDWTAAAGTITFPGVTVPGDSILYTGGQIISGSVGGGQFQQAAVTAT